ncbi:MAG: endonuclease Q family protein [bacterium]|nr:endonuclease Q family protein [bacterium]
MPKFITDFHIHSKYSRAVSQNMTLDNISEWGVKKGIEVIGTGDFTHPEWFKELTEKLERQKNGLYSLKGTDQAMWFVPSTELSCIYSQNGRGHRIHIVIVAPDLETVETINAQLGWQGNLKSDGRPILGISSIELASVVLGASSDCLIIPAHVWTPWFSLFGSMSGFDRLTDCFGEFSDQVPAIETGLSSDPPMNWRLSQLDSKQIVSFSDAHSLQNLGREATVFELESLSYKNIATALRRPTEQNKISHTIEFYPEEGKYHWDGHRNCDVRWSPGQTAQHNGLCPKCGKSVTVGVMNRVSVLADRPEGYNNDARPPYKSLVPLAEIIAEVLGVGKNSKSVQREYDQLINGERNEFGVLLDMPIDALREITLPKIAEGIQRVRKGRIRIEPGFDGEFGTVKVFTEDEAFDEENAQASLF